MSDLELAVLIAEDVVLGLGGAVNLVAGVRLVLHELRCDLFGEEDLADVRGVAGGGRRNLLGRCAIRWDGRRGIFCIRGRVSS